MGILPDYWLARPPMNLDQHTRTAFEQLLQSVLGSAGASRSTPQQTYPLTAPLWQFFCYVAEQHAIRFHGSGDPHIAMFEPRQPIDLSPFGNQPAVYAAGDGLWAMFYAIIDRQRYAMSINNACVRIADQHGVVSDPWYLFSISQAALIQQPWRTGFVYLLPAEHFVAQPAQQLGPYELRVPQYASRTPVAPLACFAVTPSDFPFLEAIRGHDDTRLHAYVEAMQTGGPWPDPA